MRLKTNVYLIQLAFFLFISVNYAHLTNLDALHSLNNKILALDRVRDSTVNENRISEVLPAINSSIEMVLGENFELYNNIILIELRVHFGITKYNYKKIGTWRNAGLIFLFGCQF